MKKTVVTGKILEAIQSKKDGKMATIRSNSAIKLSGD
jgi:hypothetical protein